MKQFKTIGLACIITATFLFAFAGEAQSRKLLSGHVPNAEAMRAPGGRLEPATKLDLAIGLPVRNPAQLDYFLRDLYNPSSTNFHHYVKPTEFTDRFGPTTDDYQHVIDFLKSAGLTVTQTHPGRMLVEVTGTSTDVEKAFQVRLLTYQHPSENRRFYAPDREPSVPPDIRILDISGLDNYAPPKSLISKIVPLDASKASPAEWSGDGLQGTYIPEDFQAAYASGISANGAGQSVGLLEFDGCFPEDFVEYARQENLPRVNLKEVRVAGATGMPGEGSPEVQLDVEMAMGIAPGLSSIILYEAPLGQAQATYGNYFNSVLIRMVEDDAASQISSSWNPPSGPHLTTDQIFQQIAAQGQSFFQASGDYGAYTNKVPQRADNPYVTIVGATSLTLNHYSGPSYAYEVVLNNETNEVSGGGISTVYPIPFYQEGVDMSANGGSTEWRNSPDVAMIGDGVYVIFSNGRLGAFGGTSVAAPMWAGYMALVNQQAASNGLPNAGFINPAIYAIGEWTNYINCFHDITSGNNTTTLSPNQYYAFPGYDLCTGWGSPTGQALATALTVGPMGLGIIPANGLAAIGPVGGPFSISNESFTLKNLGAHPLSWSVGNVPPWLVVSTNSGTLLPDQPAATITCALNLATNLPVGSYLSALVFTNLSDGTEQSIPISLNIYQFGSLQVMLAPSAVAQLGAQWSVDGGAWQNSGMTVSGLTPTTHTLEFSTVSNWISPASQIVEIGSGATNAISYAYTEQTGTVTVSLVPADACVDGAYWSVDGGPWTNSGETVTVTSATEHIISFSPIAGWVTPGDETILVNAGQTITTNAIYSVAYQFGSIYEGLNGAQGITVNSNGGIFVANTGNDTICKMILDGTNWRLAIIAGQDGSPGFVDGRSAQARFDSPVALAADAQGNIYVADSGNNAIRKISEVDGSWTVSTIVSNLPSPAGIGIDGYGNLWVTGTTFNSVDNVNAYFITNQSGVWATDTLIDFWPNTVGRETAWASSGSAWTVVLNLVTEMYNYGLMWDFATIAGGPAGNIDGPARVAQFDSPQGIAADPFGNIFVADTGNNSIRSIVPSLGGYEVMTITPISMPLGVAADSQGDVFVVGDTSVYMGSTTLRGLQVQFSSADTNAPAAEFQVDGGAWTSIGSTVRVAPGQHTITFESIPEWFTPSNLSVTITSNQSVFVTYAQVLQSLQVTLGPSNAILAGASWQLDGGPWQASGATLSDLTPGQHQLAFTNIAGWNAPAPVQFSLLAVSNVVRFDYSISKPTQPVVSIIAPKPGVWTNQTVVLSGTATSDSSNGVEISSVWYQINSNGWNQAVGTNPWSTGLILVQSGEITGQAYAIDTSGNVSKTNLVRFENEPKAPLTLTIGGKGTVSPEAGVHYLYVGKNYNFTAIPGENMAFAGWSGDISSRYLTVSFTLETNTALQANFVPNPLAPGAGTYEGLFYSPNSITPPSSGFFSATVASSGAFTGKLLLDSGSSSFSGLFNAFGQSSNYISRAINPIALTMSLDITNKTITGALLTPNWTASLQAYSSSFSKTNPAPFAGSYTMQILPGQGIGTAPNTNGTGSVAISALGNLTFRGNLGDGTALSQSTVISPQGQWPFFESLYSGSGVIVGWLNFTNSLTDALGGTLTWIKTPTTTTAAYTSGFMITNEVQGVLRTNKP